MAEAVAHLERGVAMEENLHFDEPPTWYFPVRQALGALLLKLDRAAEAEAVFKKDLQKNLENPWSLLGLAQSLKAQGKKELVPDVEKRFRRAWSRADLKLETPIF
jgi:predicted Zn-dependent protease